MSKDEILFVNEDKKKRAEAILALVCDSVQPKTEGEAEQKAKFKSFLVEAKVDPKKQEALVFVYEKLGGLIRTHREQADVNAKVEKENKPKSKSKKGGDEEADEDEDE